MIHVHLVFSPAPREVEEFALALEPGATVAQALARSGWASRFPASVGELQCGVWGRRAAADQVLRDGDRVEIYRPLKVDPKLARRMRFARQGAGTAGLFARRRPGAKAGY